MWRSWRTRSAAGSAWWRWTADASVALAKALEVGEVPALVLLCDRRPVARIEGRASGSEIEAMIRQHLADAPGVRAA